jgi:hypothetical protein
MISNLAQRGESRAGCLFWFAVLAIFVYIAYQAIPVKVNSSDLQEFMVRQAESAGSASAEQIKRAILARAKDLDLPVTPTNLNVEKGAGRIVITCSYEIPISLFVYTYHWKIEHNVDRPVFLI